MTLLHIAILAIVQGITEFLPVSSSGHLALLPLLTDLPDQGLMMDVAVHVGTLGAVVAYFWRDVAAMINGLWLMVRGRSDPDGGAKLAFYVVLATLPVIAVGYALNKAYPDAFRSVEVIGWTTLGFGVLLYASDRIGMTVRNLDHMRWGGALTIGLAQVLALVPGTSRSGITMTAARFLGFERLAAARFSMLLSIPTILGAGLLQGLKLYQSGDPALGVDAALAAGLAFITALIAIALMMAWLKRASFTPFFIYRVILGTALLAMVYA